MSGSFWTIAMLIVVMATIVLTIGLEYVLPLAQAEVVTDELAAKAGISKAEFSNLMVRTLGDSFWCRATIRTIPLGVLAVLLIVKYAQERKSYRVPPPARSER